MKTLLTILSLFLCLNLSAQKPYKSIAFDVAHVVLDATGDALMDSGQKDWGHAVNAAAVGTLLVQPFAIDFDSNDWMWKLPAYVCTRFVFFNLTYNLVHPDIDDIWYFGSTSVGDRYLNRMMPGQSQLFAKSVALTFGISITLRYAKRR